MARIIESGLTDADVARAIEVLAVERREAVP